MGRYRIAGIQPGIDPNTQPPRRVINADQARAGLEGVGVFGVDAAFNGMAGEFNVRLFKT